MNRVDIITGDILCHGVPAFRRVAQRRPQRAPDQLDSPASTSLFPRMPPLLSTEKAGREQNPVLDMTLSCFENGDQMVKCNPKWLAVSSSVGTLSQGCSSLLTGIRIGICNEPPAYAPGGDPAKALRALCTLFNATRSCHSMEPS